MNYVEKLTNYDTPPPESPLLPPPLVVISIVDFSCEFELNLCFWVEKQNKTHTFTVRPMSSYPLVTCTPGVPLQSNSQSSRYEYSMDGKNCAKFLPVENIMTVLSQSPYFLNASVTFFTASSKTETIPENIFRKLWSIKSFRQKLAQLES